MLTLEHFWEDEEFDARLTEAILSHSIDKPSIWYRIFLGISGILFIITGFLIWNIPLSDPDDSRLLGSLNAAIGSEWEWALFAGGLFLNLILGPYFAFISISKNAKLSLLIPKELREYNTLKNSFRYKEITDHYWVALKDPTHEHHNVIIRYKWMDKIRWKHRPHDFFGREKFTKMSGEEIEGQIVPKTSAAYINTNVVFDENDNPIATASPFTHPTRYLFTIPSILLAISLFSFPALLAKTASSGDFTDVLEVWKLVAPQTILLFAYFIWRNTDLFDDYLGKEKHDTMSLQVLEERLNLLREKYSAILERESAKESISKAERPYKRLPIVTSSFLVAVAFTIYAAADPEEIVILLPASFISLLLLYKHARFRYSSDSFKGYRITEKYIYLKDGIFGRKLKLRNLPEHTCVRLLDDWQHVNGKVDKGPNVCLHLIWTHSEERFEPGGNLIMPLLKPGFPTSQKYSKETLEVRLGEEDLVAWVAGVDIRFEFKTKAEQIEFAEQLSNDLSVPLRKGRKWSGHKGALEIRTIRRS